MTSSAIDPMPIGFASNDGTDTTIEFKFFDTFPGTFKFELPGLLGTAPNI